MQWIRDATAPVAPVLTAPSLSPFHSNAGSISVVGTCESGATINVTGASTQSVSCVSNAFNFSSAKSSDASYTYTITQTDSAGNTSPAAIQIWIRDTVAPAVPVVTTPSSSPFYSSVDDFTVTGTCSAGFTVRVSGDHAEDLTCSGGGTFAFTDSQTVDGTYNYSLIQIDLASNQSSAVTNQWIRDTVQPAPPAITIPSSSPHYLNGNSITISGTCLSGASVNLSGDDTQSYTCASSAFTFSVPESVDGTYTYSLLQVDRAGNTSTSVSQIWVRDTGIPNPVVISSPSDSPHYTTTDSVNISGTCEIGLAIQATGASTLNGWCSGSGTFTLTDSKSSNGTYTYNIRQVDLAANQSSYVTQVWVRDNATPSAPVITSPATTPYYSKTSPLTISGTCTTGYTVELSGGASDSKVCTASAFSFSVSMVVEGTYNFSLIQVTGPGLESSAETLQWIFDQTPPAAPVVTNPGSSPYISNANTFNLNGVCEIGAIVKITDALTQNIACTTGSYSFSSTKSTDATYTYSILQEDQAGNQSTTVSQEWQRSTAIPATPSLTNPTVNPYYSTTNALMITGTCITGNVVTLDGSSSQTYTCASNAFTFSVSASIQDTQSYTIWQTDSADTDSGSISFDWVYDATAPGAPTIVNPASSPYISGIGLTVAGTCEAFATVYFRRSSGAQLGSATCSSGGQYSISYDESTDGTYNYQVYQKDRALNASSNATLQWTRDSTIPLTPTITVPTANPYYSAESTLIITGTCENTATILLTGSATNSVVCASSTFSFSIPQNVDGTYTYTIKQRDLALNTSAAATLQWVRDANLPLVTIDTYPTNPSYSSTANFTFSASETATFECKLDVAPYTTYTSCSTPLSYASVTNGTRTFYVRARDTAGNLSAVASYSWVQTSYNTVALFHFTTAGAADFLDSGFFTNDLTNAGSTLASGSGYFVDGRNFVRGSSQSVYAPYDAESFSITRSTMTFEAFVKFTTAPASNTTQTIASQGKLSSACSSNCGWALVARRTSSKNYFSFYGSTGGTSMTEIRATKTFTAGTWYHLAVTWNKGSVVMYIDGVSVKTGTIGTAGSSKIFESTEPLRLGGWDGTNYLDGKIDEVRWSNNVRTVTKPSSQYSAD